MEIKSELVRKYDETGTATMRSCFRRKTGR